MRTRARGWAGCLGLALGLVAAPRAEANGRFPFANQLVVKSGPSADLYVRTSFGVLVSKDAGARFDWICESIIGFAGAQDPGLGVFADGAISVAAFEGLFGSGDGGCSFAADAGQKGEYVIDLAVLRDAPQAAVAVTSTGRADGYHVQALRTEDGGRTWASLGVPLGKDLLAVTIDVAPSRPQRLYVSGLRTREDGSRAGVLERSDDSGESWQRTELELGADMGLYIGAVDPVDPDVVYLRTDGVDDRLLVSRDGGKTMLPGAAFPGALLGLAVSPDGTSLAVGGPDGGVRVANTADLSSFEQRSDKKVTCLTWHATGLYACGNDFTDGFFLGRSDDGGTSWTPLVPRLRDVAGPLTTCPAGTPYALTCPPLWPAQRAALGGSGETGGAAGASGGGLAGASGATSVGGAPATGGSAGSTTATAPPPTASDDGSCAFASAPARLWPLGLFVSAVIAVAARSRARQNRRP